MKLAVSQIAWEPQQQPQALALLMQYGFAGLEIAPPRLAGPAPYEHPDNAAEFAQEMSAQHGLEICSMQSIWFGQSGCMFGQERQQLLEYTKQAILFAQAAGCQNLVFGCPKNRVLQGGQSPDDALPFFLQLGEFAAQHSTAIALEANPPIYDTNFLNTTQQVFEMAKKVDSIGCKVNLDVGTMVYGDERPKDFESWLCFVNHVHISEPYLVMIEKRQMHKELAAVLKHGGYERFVSIEMKAQPMDELERALAYVAEVFA